MYIRKSTRQGRSKTYTNYMLVESHLTPKGPRQTVVCSLGDLSPRPTADWLKLAHRVESALAGQLGLDASSDPEVAAIVEKVKKRGRRGSPGRPAEGPPSQGEMVRVDVDRAEMREPREAGSIHVGRQFWLKLGLDEILAEAGLSERARTLACAMALNRLVHPASEHAMPDWIRRTAMEDILGASFGNLAEDSLYRNLDRLHPNRAFIEKALAEKERGLFDLDATVFLYDLTSHYFEGQANGIRKAKRGHSRDKRPDCKQVVVGLVINPDGFPLAHEIFEGKTQDRQTLAAMLDLLDARVGLKKGQTVVVDRGMAFDDNLAEITSRELEYIVASRQSERDDWIGEFEEGEGFEAVVRATSVWNPFQKKSKVAVKMLRHGDETHVLCVSEGRTEKDRAIREKQEQKFLADAAKLARRIEGGKLVKPVKIGEAIGRLKERYPRVARYYPMAYDEASKAFTWRLDSERRAKAETLDGSYLLKTGRQDLSGEEVWRIYSLLTRAEAAFRAIKSPLAERPIFHKVQRRVDTHIFLCLLAYHLLVSIEQTLLRKGVHTSWATVREALKTHQISTMVLPADNGAELHIRKASTPEPEHAELYRLLGVSGQIIRPRKTWHDPPPPNSDSKKNKVVDNQRL
jgi:transposase